MSEKVVVFDLTATLSNKYSRRLLLSTRHAIDLGDGNLKSEILTLDPETSSESRTYNEFLNVYTEGSEINIEINTTQDNATLGVSGFILLTGTASFLLHNLSNTQRVELRLLYF